MRTSLQWEHVALWTRTLTHKTTFLNSFGHLHTCYLNNRMALMHTYVIVIIVIQYVVFFCEDNPLL